MKIKPFLSILCAIFLSMVAIALTPSLALAGNVVGDELQDSSSKTSQTCVFGFCPNNDSSHSQTCPDLLKEKRFSNQDLSGAKFDGANLSGTNLHNANLSRSDLTGVNLTRVELTGADLSDVKLGQIKNVEAVDFSGIDWQKINLEPKDALKLAKLKLSKSEILDLARASLSSQDFVNLLASNPGSLTNLDIDRFDFTKVNFTREQLLALIAYNLNNSNFFRSSTLNSQILLDLLVKQNLLSGVDLSGADLHSSNLSGVDYPC